MYNNIREAIFHMKKLIIGIIIGIFIGSAGAYAASEIIATRATYPILINGNTYQGSNPALNVNGSTYLPLRDTANALDVPIKWNATAERVEIGTMPATAESSTTATTNDNVTIEYGNRRVIPDKYFSLIIPAYGYNFVAFDIKITNNGEKTISFNPIDLLINYQIKDGKLIKGELPVSNSVIDPEAGITLIRYGDIAPGETRRGAMLLNRKQVNVEYYSVSWKGQEIRN